MSNFDFHQQYVQFRGWRFLLVHHGHDLKIIHLFKEVSPAHLFKVTPLCISLLHYCVISIIFFFNKNSSGGMGALHIGHLEHMLHLIFHKVRTNSLPCPGIFSGGEEGTFLPGKVLKGLCRGSRGRQPPGWYANVTFENIDECITKINPELTFLENIFQQKIGIFWGKLSVFQENFNRKLNFCWISFTFYRVFDFSGDSGNIFFKTFHVEN